MRHVSTEIVHLPPAGVDPKADRAIEAGQVRDVTRCTVIAGQLVPVKAGETETVRVGRTKGVTYRRYAAVAGMKRRDHRAAA